MIRQFQGPSEPLESLFESPAVEPIAVVVFGHPHPLYASTMHIKVVYRAAKPFLDLGYAVSSLALAAPARAPDTGTKDRAIGMTFGPVPTSPSHHFWASTSGPPSSYPVHRAP